MLSVVSGWAEKRWPWALLALSALSLELTALFFQYVMKLDPCVMCVYERAATLGVAVAGLVGFIAPRWIIARLVGYLLWGFCTIKGVLLAIEHVGYQFPDNPFAGTCSFFPEFWLPLDKWVPFLFEPTGLCDEIQWVFLGYTMPQWLVVCYAVYGVILAAVLLCRLIVARKA